jgi:hypothetical protein
MRTDGRTDRQTYTYDEANKRFSQFCEKRLRIATRIAQEQILVAAGNKYKFPLTSKLRKGRRPVFFGTFDVTYYRGLVTSTVF